MTSKIEFSIIVPVLNEQDSLQLLTDEIKQAMESGNYSFEIIFIDDGSSDKSVSILKNISKNDARIKVEVFGSRRGKSEALNRGFALARGNYIATLDADLQDVPMELLNLFDAKQSQNVDFVNGWRKLRNDPWHKILSSALFNFFTRFATGLKFHDFNCGIKLCGAEVAKSITLYGEMHRFIPAVVFRKGFSVAESPVEHRARKFGKSKFGAARAWGMFVDLLTVSFLMRYGLKPARFFSAIGFLFLIIGGIINGHLFLIKCFGGEIAPHYPYMFLGFTLFLGGLQSIFFGLLSEMILRKSDDENQNLS